MRKLWVILFFAIIVVFFSCDAISDRFTGDSDKAADPAPAKVDSGVMESILLTRVDQLRMRKYPNIKSNILTTLDDNMPVRFMGEETDFVESIGSSRGTWKRVRTLDDRFEGWVYSGEGFVEWMLTPSQRDSISDLDKGLIVFGNLTKPEFADFSGSSLTGEAVGTRYTGWYTFDLSSGPKPIDYTIKVISRKLDVENKKVDYLHCQLVVTGGMPSTALTCSSSEASE